MDVNKFANLMNKYNSASGSNSSGSNSSSSARSNRSIAGYSSHSNSASSKNSSPVNLSRLKKNIKPKRGAYFRKSGQSRRVAGVETESMKQSKQVKKIRASLRGMGKAETLSVLRSRSTSGKPLPLKNQIKGAKKARLDYKKVMLKVKKNAQIAKKASDAREKAMMKARKNALKAKKAQNAQLRKSLKKLTM